MAASSSSHVNEEIAQWAVKRITFMDRENIPILCQNNNGPCPLLAIANILSLRNMISLPPRSREVVDLRTLTSLVAEQLLSMPASISAGHELDARANLDACLSVLGHLSTGLDVNPRFNDCEGFEATQELTLFDLLGINIIHGWIVDPSDQATTMAFGSKTYNEVVELMVNSGIYDEGRVELPARMSSKGTPVRADRPLSTIRAESQAPEVIAVSLSLSIDEASGKLAVHLTSKEDTGKAVHLQEEEMQRVKASRAQALIVREFLESFASQLTPYGLASLTERMRENQLAIFFRNLHFSVIFKHEGNLFLLVTDQGYQSEPNVVWELISRVDGATDLCNSAFLPYTALSSGVLADQGPSEAYLAALAGQQISEEDAAAIALAATEGFGADEDEIPPALIALDDHPHNTPPPPPPPGSPVRNAIDPHAPFPEPALVSSGQAGTTEDADLALALQLQEEENLKAEEERERRRQRDRAEEQRVHAHTQAFQAGGATRAQTTLPSPAQAAAAPPPPPAPSTTARKVGGAASSIQHEEERQKLNRQLAEQRVAYAQAHAQARASQAAGAGTGAARPAGAAGGRGQSAPTSRSGGQVQGRGGAQPPQAGQQESNCVIS